ncbi:conserved hypothetical protein [Clostridium neonatale]|uniref:hypothetical protein n=1 Tax=Clostridium neonatale TaxID=137838 RepID=UPI00291B71DE|nr:hypothetical protein [Clostridium neonatale]CAI3238680.1 conserved hypothetical protein [Clostridium neonatale]CAI3539717.1 conserved hypothetical protein [Clostridium neonatale]
MGRKKNDEIPKSDFEVKESQDLLSFDSEADLGECVASFSFGANTYDDSNASSINIAEEAISTKSNVAKITNIEKTINPSYLNTNEDLFDNRTIPIANGATPILDGETPDVKRTYTLRASTVRKVNELKGIHPDINACVSTIVDKALEYYYKYIIEEGGTQ